MDKKRSPPHKGSGPHSESICSHELFTLPHFIENDDGQDDTESVSAYAHYRKSCRKSVPIACRDRYRTQQTGAYEEGDGHECMNSISCKAVD